MLLRRHHKKAEEIKLEKNDKPIKEPTPEELLNGLTVKQLKGVLEENEIEYDSKAKKADLINLLVEFEAKDLEDEDLEDEDKEDAE